MSNYSSIDEWRIMSEVEDLLKGIAGERHGTSCLCMLKITSLPTGKMSTWMSSIVEV